MGFPDVAKFYLQQSYHMANNIVDVMFNKARHDALPEEIKAILKHVPHAAHADMMWKSMHGMSQDYIDIQTKDKVRVYRTPTPILDAQLKAWDSVVQKHSAANPLFAKVIESQKTGEARHVLAQQHAGQPDGRLLALLPEGSARLRAGDPGRS